ncbi:hypothetical protein FPV25_03160 [Carnobacterium sp. PL17GRE32]|uniref:hypothetical protein n=1 Tax=Carnobacterium sp. PL17GRE32 TaxID=2592355 RepID=UPI0011EFC85E|nr:hypothetical protein [Carnobacterium sp. PL17GRE32]KAF3306028.1 hypothetical protein FPV25_03160 [Carnobacterium sp. PL17GRE32]
MRTFQLDNVVKKTDNEVKAKKYLALGFKEIGIEETEQQEQTESINLNKLDVKGLKEVADDRGIEYAKNATKDQMLELLGE